MTGARVGGTRVGGIRVGVCGDDVVASRRVVWTDRYDVIGLKCPVYGVHAHVLYRGTLGHLWIN
jgi:hypothetical protein